MCIFSQKCLYENDFNKPKQKPGLWGVLTDRLKLQEEALGRGQAALQPET